jgi:hypothetical protein
MAAVHRNTDSRACGASTNVAGQSTVYVNNKLCSVNNDPNSHGGGNLKADNPDVYVNNKLVVIQGNGAAPDDKCPLPGGSHCDPNATSGSVNTAIGGE